MSVNSKKKQSAFFMQRLVSKRRCLRWRSKEISQRDPRDNSVRIQWVRST